jgi:hypothetical protein
MLAGLDFKTNYFFMKNKKSEVAIQSLQLRKFEINQFHWWDYHICNFLNPSKKLAEPQGY